MSGGPLRLLRAAAVTDAATINARPGALLLEDRTIVAAGTPESLGIPAEATVEDLPRAVLCPPFVNAHAHLDLSHIGPVPFDGDFSAWVDRVRVRRAGDEAGIAASVRRGVALSRAGGTAFVGDIAGAGSSVPLATLRAERLGGVSFREVFGIGRNAAAAAARVRSWAAEEYDRAGPDARLGLQPHAPYSCGAEVYRAAAATGRPIATHLAETPEEIAFVSRGTGPLADLLRRIGAWEPGIGEDLAARRDHPVDAVAGWLAGAPAIAAHVNYVEPRHLAVLRAGGITVAYCPRASAYFGHPRDGRAPHAYRAMLAAGVRVALGTDSVLCLDTPARLSVLDEMRLLHRRDGTCPRTLLAMATTAGATALGIDPDLVSLRPGRPIAGLLALETAEGAADPLAAALAGSDAPPRWILGPLHPPSVHSTGGGAGGGAGVGGTRSGSGATR